MTTEFQPVDPRIPFYIPENWLQPTGSGGVSGSFINYPTAQTANISFPGAILCSNLKSFAPTAPMNLYNDSTTGSIQIGNNSGYTGGIVINSNAVPPVANTIRIGDTSRPVIMSKVKLLDIEPIGAAGVFVNCDMTIANGSELFVNEIKPNTILRVSLPNGATTLKPEDTDTSTRVVTSQWVRNQGYVSAIASDVTYDGAGPFTTIQTFDAGIKTNSIALVSGSSLSLPSSVITTPPIPDNTTLVPNTSWVTSTITNALNATTLFAKLAGTAAFTVLQTFNLGIKTNSIALVSGSTLSLPNILTNSIGLVSGSTLSLPNILTNSIGLVSGTTLSLPAATTTAPSDTDTGSRVVTSQWVRNQGYVSAIASDVTYDGAGPFTTLQTFTSGIKTDSIVTNSASFLSLPVSTVPTIDIEDSSSKVVYTSWVNTKITNAIDAISGFVTYNGSGPFTTKQFFNAGMETTEIQGITTTATLAMGTSQTPGGALNLGSNDSMTNIRGIITLSGNAEFENTINTDKITSRTTSGTLLVGWDQIPGGTVQVGSASSIVKTNNIQVIDPTLDTLTIGGGAVRGNYIAIGDPFLLQNGGVYIGRNCAGGISIGDVLCSTMNIGADNTNFFVRAFRKVETLRVYGTSISTVDNIIGSIDGLSSCINRCVARIATTSPATQNVFNIDTAFKFTPPSTLTPIIVSQMFELYINGRNTGNDNVYSQKSSFIVSNTAGSVQRVGYTFTTDKDYTSGLSSVSVFFNQPSATRMVITVTTPSTGSTGQYYFATLVSYPTMNGEGNFQFAISTA